MSQRSLRSVPSRCGIVDRLLRWASDHPCPEARRRRLLWHLRFLIVCMCVGWTALVALRSSHFSAIAFSGGLCTLCVMLHALDYPDVVNYSDVVVHKS